MTLKKTISVILIFTILFLFIPLYRAFGQGIHKETAIKGLGLTLLLIFIIHFTQERLAPPLEEEMVVPLNAKEIDLLARIIHAEARGEPYEGKIAVGAVVINRIKSPLFPNHLQEVIDSKNQFEPVSDGSIFNRPNRESRQAAFEALRGEDPSLGALYFYNRDLVIQRGTHHIITWFDDNTTITTIIGNHTFAR